MGGMSSQVLWKQAWNSEAESTLKQSLMSQRCTFRELSPQLWDPKTRTIGGVRDHMTTYLAPAAEAWSSAMLHLNSLIGEPLAAELSRLINGPAVVVFEYDQATWGYTLFNSAKLLDRFWSIPEFVEVAPQDYAGNAEIVSSTFGVPRDHVAPSLQDVTDLDEAAKAFADDEFTLRDHWVRVDFLGRLGLNYPGPGEAVGGKYVKIDEPKR